MDIKGLVKGLHHVTATVNDAQEDYDFYSKMLGLRLVKKTVNFDNEKVYHFYYANKIGLPSTVFTTFPYKGQGVRGGVIGAGQATHTAFSVPAPGIDFWRERLSQFGRLFTQRTLFGLEVLEFNDPSGLHIQILGAVNDRRAPVWEVGGIPEYAAVRGIHHVMLLVKNDLPVIDFLESFGYRVSQKDSNITMLEAGEGGPGNTLMVQSDPAATSGINGLGTVHHVAHRVDQLADSLAIREYLKVQWGLTVTDVLDRKYFESIYFRIPGGILFEVATSGPGFLIDEPIDKLGGLIQLPDWQEPHRVRIEAHLLKLKK